MDSLTWYIELTAINGITLVDVAVIALTIVVEIISAKTCMIPLTKLIC
jgi:hypothetical protein